MCTKTNDSVIYLWGSNSLGERVWISQEKILCTVWIASSVRF